METSHKSTMKGINSRTAFRKKKSLNGAMLRLILAAGVIVAFFITHQGILDSKPDPRKALGDKDLAAVLATLSLPDPKSPAPGSREQRLAKFGKKLFFDTRLSSNGQVSCATCHQPDKSFTDGLPTARGMGVTNRNSPTILNGAMAHWFFWDGRADSLAAQAVGPLENPNEHGLTGASLAAMIEEHYGTEYQAFFGKTVKPGRFGPTTFDNKIPVISAKLAAYTLASVGPYERLTDILKAAGKKGMQPSELVSKTLAPTTAPDQHLVATEVAANVGLAISTWEKLQISNKSPFDFFLKRVAENPESSLQSLTDERTFSIEALAGLRIFTGKGNCSLCHRGALLSDQQFHNIGLGETPRQQELPIASWLLDVAGRAKGQFDVLNSEFNCQSMVWSPDNIVVRRQSESCREQEFTDLENFENVGAFKTPTLRNVAMTGPYFHDGRAATIDEVLSHYDQLKAEPVIGHREESLRPLDLAPQEKQQLKIFLQTLTSPARDLSEY